MLMEVKKHLKLIGMYFKFNLSSAIEYRVSFLMQTFGMILNNSTFIFFWWILFNNIEEIGGYGFREVMTIWAIAAATNGITCILFGNSRNISRIIIDGELDSYLLQPKNLLINLLASKTIVYGWGDFTYAIILFIGVHGLNPQALGLFGLFSVLGALLVISLLVVVHSLTFYIGDAQGVATLVLEFLISFSIYPEGIYKGISKIIIYTLIPAAFIGFIPVRLMNQFSWGWFLILIGTVVGWVLFAYFFFQKGLKRYESGNLIVSKL